MRLPNLAMPGYPAMNEIMGNPRRYSDKRTLGYARKFRPQLTPSKQSIGGATSGTGLFRFASPRNWCIVVLMFFFKYRGYPRTVQEVHSTWKS